MKSKEKSSVTTRKTALCAMLAALSVVIMYFGSLIDVLDLSMAALASMCAIIAVIDAGGVYPWLVYAVSSVSSGLLLTQKSTAIFYAAFLGYYPIVKEKLERLKKPVAWLLKILIFNAAFVSAYILLKFFATLPDAEPYMILIVWLMAQVTFILYDIALTRLITFYIVKIRPRFKSGIFRR